MVCTLNYPNLNFLLSMVWAVKGKGEGGGQLPHVSKNRKLLQIIFLVLLFFLFFSLFLLLSFWFAFLSQSFSFSFSWEPINFYLFAKNAVLCKKWKWSANIWSCFHFLFFKKVFIYRLKSSRTKPVLIL